MRVFLSKPFARFVLKEAISQESLCDAVERAGRGLIGARLGDGVIKQRIPRRGQGKSGGYRVILLYAAGGHAVFVYGFAKSERDNIAGGELRGFRKLAQVMLTFGDSELEKALKSGALEELMCNEQNIQK